MNNRNRSILIMIGITVFFITLFVYYAQKAGLFSNNTKQQIGVTNTTIITFDQPKLKVFDDLYFLNPFPDTIRIHDPYILIIIPENYKQVTTVYDTRKKVKVAMLTDIALDFDFGNMLYNKNGLTTIYNKQSLGMHCAQGFIQSSISILCITAKASDPRDNKLITINPQTLEKHDVYASQNYLTAVSVINGILYIGEVNLTTKQAFVRVNNVSYPMPSPVDLLYPMQSNVYFATFKRPGQNESAKYYLLQMQEKSVVVQLQETGKILFYK